MLKNISLGLLPIRALMLIISRFAEFSLNDAVVIGGVLLILPSTIWLAIEIYKKISQEINLF